MNASQQMAARRYRIERYLTEGGMGAIYIGKKLGPGGFEKEVVLKQLLPEYTSRPEFRDLFFREAKISATLDHANIVHTFDLVESDESLFIVMEYVRGVDLRTIVRRARLRRRELAPAAAIHVTLDVLAGLGYAHTRRDSTGASMNIIHRDVSPSNILCSAQGETKLSDFGIAKASTHSSVFYRVRGKVGYMSPEQARNEPIDHRSDLYSLAVCLYEALTGERLFVGDLSTPPDVIYGQPILPPSKKRPSLYRGLDEVLARALAPRPENRYQDANAFTDALRQVAHRAGLLYSAPQLAEHLHDILGPDPSRWLQEDTAAPEGGTQKIPIKDLQGKEAASIGVVEGSNLYVVSGGDVVSPSPEAAKQKPMSPSRPKDDETTRKASVPAPPRTAASPFIPITEDDEDAPTVARDRLPGAVPPPAKRPTSTAPYATLAPGGAKRPMAAPPPPPPPAAFAPPSGPPPPPPLFAGSTPSFTAPPPPPMPPSRAFSDSPYDSDMATPLPPPTDEFAPPTPLPTYPVQPIAGVPFPSPGNSWPAPAPSLNLQPPEMIDFAADAQPIVVKRSGPPGLLVLIVMLGAMAGGAKLAHYVTRGDVAALETVATSTPATPTK
jgi:serine/threonine protein kinase